MADERFPLIYCNNILGDGYDGYPDDAEGFDGQNLALDGFTNAVVHDLNNGGSTGDNDYDDTSTTFNTAGKETWTIKGQQKVLWEIAKYNDCTIYYKDGSSVIIDATVLMFEDGTYAISSKFDTFEYNTHVYRIHPSRIDYARGIDLGKRAESEYSTVDDFEHFRDFFTCFTTGTLIESAAGLTPIEALCPGDAVRTLDHGYQSLRWVGSRELTCAELDQHPELVPVRIRAGVLGQGLPNRDLMVSHQHRILVRSKIAQKMFGEAEVLVPAIKLVGHEGIELAMDATCITYWHLLFDQHEIIFSEGAPTESLFTGPMAMKALSADARKEIENLFPQICHPEFTPKPARVFAKKAGAIKRLVSRHAKNGQPLLFASSTPRPLIASEAGSQAPY